MNRRSSAKISNKKQVLFTKRHGKNCDYSSDSSFEDEKDTPCRSTHHTPRKSKLAYSCGGTPPKQKKLETTPQKCTSISQSSLNTPSLEKLSINTPTKSSRKSLFSKNGMKERELKIISTENDISESGSDYEELKAPKNKNVYQSARRALHGTLPTEMPGREKELDTLRNFVEEHIKSKTSASLYVSGPPGTGKTASLNMIIQEININFNINHAYVNCTAIKSPTTIYSRICKELNIKVNGKSEKDHVTQIEKYLKKKHKPILLVLDEIDQLETKSQSVLYTIFEWPSKPDAQLLLIGIANALDLTDRVLPRLQTRCELKPTLMHFAPYNKPQIIEIFTSRLKAAGVFDIFSPLAVQMLASKVAVVSGDVRRALDIGRRVIDLAEQSKKNGALKSVENLANKLVDEEMEPVNLNEVLSVLNNVYGTSQTLKTCKEDSFPLQQKIIICSLLLLINNNKNKHITIGKLHEVYRKVCDKRKIGSVDQTEFVGLCSLIETKGIISISGKKEPRLNKVSMVWDQEEVTDVLKDKQLISEILQDTSCVGKV